MNTAAPAKVLALRPFHTGYKEHAWWVHLDDGDSVPLCGKEYGQSYSLIPEEVDTDYPHMCEPCQQVRAHKAQRWQRAAEGDKGDG